MTDFGMAGCCFPFLAILFHWNCQLDALGTGKGEERRKKRRTDLTWPSAISCRLNMNVCVVLYVEIENGDIFWPRKNALFAGPNYGSIPVGREGEEKLIKTRKEMTILLGV